MSTSAVVNATPGVRYQLSDELARLCLPHKFKDFCRSLAWANSVCALFLAVGVVVLKPPQVHFRTITPAVDPSNFEFLTPPEPLESVEIKPDVADLTPSPSQSPHVPIVVLDTDLPKFPTYHEGPAIVTPTPSVPFESGVVVVTRVPSPTITKFGPNTSDTEGGYYPLPVYPPFARKNNYQGTCKIEMLVGASGAVTSVKVIESSGYSVLDQAAIEVVQKRWRFPAGSQRHFWYPFVFELVR